jgi:hypothetical protein
MKTTIAIDPGVGGGLAILRDGEITLHAMPESLSEIADLIRSNYHNATIVCEEVPKFCGGKLPESTTYVMAQNFGRIEGIVAGLQARLVRVHPKTWQKTFSVSRDGKKHGPWKARLKALSRELFPHLDITNKTADALLILEHAKRNNL